MIETDESHPLPHAYLVSTSLDVARIQRTLILGMDGSENADFAFEWTLKNILRPGDHLILVQVYPTADAVDLYSLTGDWTAELKRSVEHQVKEMHKKYLGEVSKLFQQYTLTSLVKVGEPRDTICELAQEKQADMLILGSRGLGFVKRLLVGSVSEFCVKNSGVPTVIVPYTDKKPSFL